MRARREKIYEAIQYREMQQPKQPKLDGHQAMIALGQERQSKSGLDAGRGRHRPDDHWRGVHLQRDVRQRDCRK